MQFTIPLQRQDLLVASGPDQYRVEKEYSVRDLRTKLRDVKHGADLASGKAFDVFFSVLTNFHKDMPREMKETTFEILCVAIDDFIRRTDSFLCSSDASSTEKKSLVTEMKMVAYLFCQLVEMLEGESQQLDSAAVAIAGTKSKRGKKRPDDDEFGWDWDAMRKRSVILFFRLVSLNVAALFDPPLAEEEFINLLGNCMFRLLENPVLAHQKNKDVRTSVLQVLATLNARFSYGLSCQLKMVQALKHFEHLVVPFGEAMEMFCREFGCNGMVMETVREISSLDAKELSRDTSGTRACSLFLLELGERLPELVQPCVSLLTNHLDGESYMLRKSVLQVFAEIVMKTCSGEALEPAAREARDRYLDCLEDHLHDVHAFVRSGVLQAWGKLCVAKSIPLTRQLRLLKLVVGRLQDKSSNVRKQAVQLLTALLQCNPYNAVLPVEDLREQFEKENEKLKSLVGADESEREADRLKAWPPIAKALQQHLDDDDEEEVEESDAEHLWEDASAGEVHERIRHHLTKRNFASALSLLVEAKEKFPAFRNLEAISEEGDSIVGQLRTIFFLPLDDPSTACNDADDDDSNNEVARQKFLVSYLDDSVKFANGLNDALPVVCMLLGSKQITDVLEAVQFFVSAFEFGLLNAMMGVRQMLSLIFSREQTVRKAVVDAYRRLYVGDGEGGKSNATQTVKNLVALVSGATVGDLAGLEDLIGMLVESGDLDKTCFQVMWQHFTKVMPDSTDERSRGALVLLGMVASSEPSIILSNVGVVVEHGLKQPDFRLAHDACCALLKISTAVKTSTTDPDPPFKFPSDHELFSRLESMLVDGIERLEDDHYVSMAQQAVAVIYNLSESPDRLCETICRRMCAKFVQTQDGADVAVRNLDQSQLKRLVFVVGHVAVCQLRHLDVSVFNELKRRRALRELKKEAKNKVVRRSSVRRSGVAKEDDEDMGVVGAEADDIEAEFVRSVCEKEIINGTDNLLAAFAPVVAEVCGNPTKYSDPGLKAAASLTLAKYMLVSSEFCEQHLQLMFTILEKSDEPVIRANMIIAAGDLSFRFPNTIEPWTPRMYACLRDASPLVRSNALTVLTHLILNDMIKVRGQISDMALCIVDDVPKISNLAKLFFTELARKGNALYNVMPDVVSGLSDPGAGIQEDKFRQIMKYVIGLIEKDKHLESLVEKLCLRFRATQTPRQWRDLSFCLAIFNYGTGDKALRKLLENFSCFGDKLHENEVYDSFNQIVVQARKAGSKQDSKLVLEELCGKIDEARAKGVEDDGANKRANDAAAVKCNRKNARPPRRRTTAPEEARSSSSEEEDEENSDRDDEDDNDQPEKVTKTRNEKTKTIFAVPKVPPAPPSATRSQRPMRSRRR